MHSRFAKPVLSVTMLLLCQQLIPSCNTALAQGQQLFAAPNGTSAGDGSRERPWDLSSALNGHRISPGSTLWLRGGTYVGVFTSTLTGTEAAPITVRSYAGERAIISDNRERASAGTINVKGAWTIYRDFEITNVATGRGSSHQFRPMGFEVTGPHNRFINLVIHDTGFGMGVWKEAVDAEIYGNIIFNGGSQNVQTDQTHGHGIYTQNNEGIKSIRDNVIFNQFGWGIHAWPNPGNVDGYDIEGNVLFNNGILSSSTHFNNNLLVDSHAPFHTARIRIVSNYTYDFPSAIPGSNFYDAGVCLLCIDPRPEAGDDLTLQDNYFVGGAPAVIIGNWKRISVSGNTFISDKGLVAFAGPKQSGTRQLTWDRNRYFGQGLEVRGQKHVAFVLENKLFPFTNWTQESGLDRGSSFSADMPGSPQVFIRPNKYEPGRANIIVYNWNRQDRVPVDLRSVLKTGDRYVVLNVQDFFAEPVLSGVFDGKPLSLPMTGLRVAIPVGRSSAPESTGPAFAVFVVRTSNNATASASPGQASGPTQSAAVPENPSRFTGLFVSADKSARVRISVDSGRLLATILNEPNHPSYALVPESATRFRLDGAPPGFFADFEVDQQRVKSLTLERGRYPAVRLKPEGSDRDR